MNLKEKIIKDLNVALKEKREIKVLTLRQLLAAILNKEKEKRNKLAKEKGEIKEEELAKESQLTDEEVISVVSSEIKKRKEAILEFEKGERQDLAEKEKKELEILQEYLPEQLSEQELKKLAKEIIEKIGATSQKDIKPGVPRPVIAPQLMGKVMAELMPKIKGRAEGGLVSKIVRELLS